jgi:hypothetical protein
MNLLYTPFQWYEMRGKTSLMLTTGRFFEENGDIRPPSTTYISNIFELLWGDVDPVILANYVKIYIRL